MVNLILRILSEVIRSQCRAQHFQFRGLSALVSLGILHSNCGQSQARTACSSPSQNYPHRNISTPSLHQQFSTKSSLTLILDMKKWRSAKRPSLDDVEALSHGKPTRTKVGSRGIPHHLYKHEREAFEAAKRRNYCKVHKKDRVNIANIWYLWCLAKGMPCIHYYYTPPYHDSFVVDLSTIEASKGQKGIKATNYAYCAMLQHLMGLSYLKQVKQEKNSGDMFIAEFSLNEMMSSSSDRTGIDSGSKITDSASNIPAPALTSHLLESILGKWTELSRKL